MKKAITFLIPLSLSLTLTALPSHGEVVSGDAAFKNVNPALLQIVTSDKAIINYSDFNIGEKEKVQFIQPSKDASVLNRITSKNPSKILGSLEANGKVFLVNPNGIYFGKDASVNTGAFLASTLNISDKDFLNGTFSFTTQKNSTSSIVNEGSLNSPEGFIALLAPTVENKGSVIAESGRIFIGSAEKITLDFSGDGLMKFSLDGELEKALIENAGLIKTQDGSVNLSLKAANKAIKMTVNTDGITPANHLEEVNGLIVLSAKGTIKGDVIHIEGQDGSAIQISGALDASNLKDTSSGGSIKILGDQISLKGASVEASGNAGGGEILIGGDYKGEGAVRNAKNSVVDEGSTIQADALAKGDGGRVILWSDGVTLFNGKISTNGGYLGGDGGFVETSGKRGLGIYTGNVNATARKGIHGTWLLDPDTITISGDDGTNPDTDPTSKIAAAGEESDSSSNLDIKNTSFQSSQIGTINLYAASNITINSNAPISTNADLIFSPLTPSCTTTINSSITAAGITFGSTNPTLTNNVILGSSGITLTATGGNITFYNKLDSTDRNQGLVLNAINGSVYFYDAVGTTNALKSLSVTSPQAYIASKVYTNAGAISFSGATALTGAATLDTTNNDPNVTGANITLNNMSGAYDLTLNGGTTGSVTLGKASTTSILKSVTVTKAASITQNGNIQTSGVVTYGSGTSTPTTNLNGNITTTSTAGKVTVNGPLSLLATSTIDTTSSNSAGANIILNNISGSNFDLTLKGGTAGLVNFGKAVTPSTLNSITVPGAASIVQNGDLKTSGAVSYGSASTTTTLNGNITTTSSSGAVSVNGPMNLSASSTIDTTNNGAIGSTAGANITLNNISGSTFDLTLKGGTTGIVTFGKASTTSSLNSITVTNAASVTQNGNITTTGAVSYGSASTTTNLKGNITTTSSSGAVSVNGPLNLLAASTIDTTSTNPAGANITLNSTSGAPNLTLKGGTSGAIQAGQMGSSSAVVGSISITGKTALQQGPIYSAGGITFSCPSGITLQGDLLTTNSSVSLSGPVTLGSGTINLGSTAGSAAVSINGAVTGAPTTTLNIRTGPSTLFNANLTGKVSSLSSLQFSGNNFTQTGQIDMPSGSVTLASGSGGTVTFGDSFLTLPSNVSSISITGSPAIIQNGPVVSTSTGTTKSIDYTGTSVKLGGNITANGMPVSIVGPTTLNVSLSSVTIDTTGTSPSNPAGTSPAGADVSMGSIDGFPSLKINSGTSGTTQFGIIGGTTKPNGLTVTAATIKPSSVVNTTSSITFTGQTLLSMNSAFTSTQSNITLGSVGSVVSTPYGLTLNAATGTVTIGKVGFTQDGVTPALTTLTATGLTIKQVGPLNTSGAVTITGSSSGTVTLGDDSPQSPAASSVGSITVSGTPGTITQYGALTSNTNGTNFGINYTAPNINLNGNLTAKASPITLNGTLNLSTDVTLSPGDGFPGVITISGPVYGSKALKVERGGDTYIGTASTTTAFNVTELTCNSQTITQNGSITSTGPVSYGPSTITVKGSLNTEGKKVTISGNFKPSLSGTISIDTTGVAPGTSPAGADIKLDGPINGTSSELKLNAGTEGAVTLTNATNVKSLTVDGASIVLGSNLSTVGGGDILIKAPVKLSTSITVSGSGAVTFGSTIDSATTASSLTITPVSGKAVTLSGIIGSQNPLYNLSIPQSSTNGAVSIGDVGTSSTPGVNGQITLFGKGYTSNSTWIPGITFTGTNYNANTQIYGASVTGDTSDSDLQISQLSGVKFLSNGNALTFNGGTLTKKGSETTLSIDTTGTNGLGIFNFVQLGKPDSYFNTVNITASPYDSTVTPTSTKPVNTGSSTTTPTRNVYARVMNSSDNAKTVISTDQSYDATISPLQYTTPVVIQSNGTINLISDCGSDHDVIFNSTLDADTGYSPNLVIQLCGNSAYFNKPVGSINPLQSISIQKKGGSADPLSAGPLHVGIYDTMKVGSFTQTEGTGTTYIAGSLTTGDINLTTNKIDLTPNTNSLSNTITAGGAITLNHTGNLISPRAITGGSFSQNSTAGIVESLSGSITTANGAISFASPITLTADTTLKTDGSANSNITLGKIDGAKNLTLDAGTSGKVMLQNDIGQTTALNSIVFSNASEIQLGGKLATSGSDLAFTKPLTLTSDTTITSSNKNITFTSIGGAKNLSVDSGTGSISFSQIGTQNSPIGTLTTKGNDAIFSNPVFVSGSSFKGINTHINNSFSSTADIGSDQGNTLSLANVITGAGAVNFSGTLKSVSLASINSPAITLSTVQGTAGLLLDAGSSGAVILKGPVGSLSAPVETLNITSGTIDQQSTAIASKDITYTGLTKLGGSISSTGGKINLSRPVTLTGDVTLTANSTPVNPVNPLRLSLSDTVDGSFNLTLDAGTNGNVALSKDIGKVTPLNSLSVTAAKELDLYADIQTQGSINIPCPVVLQDTATLETSGSTGADISLGLMGGSHDLTLNAGTSGKIVLNGDVGQLDPLASLSLNAAEIDLAANITTNSPLSLNTPLKLSHDATLTTNNGSDITLNSTVDSTIDANYTLTFNAGSVTAPGKVILNGDIGKSIALKNITFTNASEIDLAASLQTGGPDTLEFTKPVNIKGDTEIKAAGNVSFDSTVNTDQVASFALKIDSPQVGFSNALGSSSANGLHLSVSGANALFDDAVNIKEAAITSSDITIAKDFNVENGLTISGDLALWGNVSTTNGSIDLSGDITLKNDAIIKSNDHDTTLAGVNGPHRLTVNAGTGILTLNGDITANSVQLTASNHKVGANVTASTQAAEFTGPITLTGDSSIKGLASGIIFTDSSIDGPHNLTLDVGLLGTSTLPSIGSTDPIGALTVKGTNNTPNSYFSKIINLFKRSSSPSTAVVQLNKDITTNGGAAIFETAVNLTGDVAITTTANAGSGADITFEKDVTAGAINLTLDAGTGTSAFRSAAPLQLKSLNIKGNTEVSGDVSTSGDLKFQGDLTVTGNSTTLSATVQDSSITVGGKITGSDSTQDVTLKASTVSIGGASDLSTLSVDAPSLTVTASVKTAGDISATGDVHLSGDLESVNGGISITKDLHVTPGAKPKLKCENGELKVTGTTNLSAPQ